MNASKSNSLERDAAVVREMARTIGSKRDYDGLIEKAGDAQCVLIGEASHGTHEFYATRAELTRRLIEEKGFRAVRLGGGLAGHVSRASLRQRAQRG